MPSGKLRAVFVHSSAPGEGESPPLGAGCAAASLIAAGMAAREDLLLLDAGTYSSEARLIDALLAFRPDLAGFSLYAWNSMRLVGLASRLREASPSLLIVAGGPDAERLAAALPPPAFLDAIFLGEAESSFPAWIASEHAGVRAADQSPLVLRGPLPEASSLPSPWTSGLLSPAKGGKAAWELVRGCPYRCAYCYEGRGRPGIRALGRERIEAELELLRSAGVAEVFVLDPTFNARGAEALSLLALLAARGGDIHWNFEIRAELLDRAQARAFALLSCSLQVGLQSADPVVLAALGRSVDRKKFASKARLLDEAGLVYGFDLIYGLPGDSLAGFKDSIDYALSLSPNHLDIFPLAVLPGTSLYESRKELALDSCEEPPYLLRSSPGFSVDDMEAAGRLAASTMLFYSAGRAVPWFRAVLKPLGLSPSAFMGLLDSGGLEPGDGHRRIEEWQCSHVDRIYRSRHLERLIPAALDLIRYHGAWSRAFAEGEGSSFGLSYPLDLVEGPAMLEIERVSREYRPRPRLVEIRPGRDGPEAHRR